MSLYDVYDVGALRERLKTMTMLELVEEYALVYNLLSDTVDEMHAFRGFRQFPVEQYLDAGSILAERIAEIIADSLGYKLGEDGRYSKVCGA